MNIRCENCGHAALDTDSSCWHCGEPLPGREEAGRKKIKVRESWTRGAGPGSVAIFGGLTLLVTLASLLVMSSLGSQPQLQVRLGTRTPPDWSLLTAADNAFTVTLPDRWSWLDSADREAGPQLDALIESTPRLRLATHPLGAETDDMTILFAAGNPLPGDGQTPFLVVAVSPLLNRLTYQETVDFLSNSGDEVQFVRFVDDFDKSHVSILVDIPLDEADSGDDGGETIRCWQQFVLGRQQSLLITLCAPVESYDVYNNTFDQIMASFQHLNI